jgi:hypothetical protein
MSNGVFPVFGSPAVQLFGKPSFTHVLGFEGLHLPVEEVSSLVAESEKEVGCLLSYLSFLRSKLYASSLVIDLLDLRG